MVAKTKQIPMKPLHKQSKYELLIHEFLVNSLLYAQLHGGTLSIVRDCFSLLPDGGGRV